MGRMSDYKESRKTLAITPVLTADHLYCDGQISDGVAAMVLHAGTLVLVPAARVHSCNPLPASAWSYQMLHLDTAWLDLVRREYTIAQADPGANSALRIVRSPALYAQFCSLNALLFSDTDSLDKESAMIEFIGDCDGAPGAGVERSTASPDLAARILPAMELLRHTSASNTPLQHLARAAGMSRYQLIRAFRAATGLTPHAWQLNQRVNLGRELLRGGKSIAQVAHSLGFADQAHFQRVFKAHAGVTPGCFRA